MEEKTYDVIIIGGSYAGLSAAMSLGRALRSVLVIDSGKPCNRQTPHSHNFLTQDGNSPKNIATISKLQVLKYDTVTFFEGNAMSAKKQSSAFTVKTDSGNEFRSKKLILATGLKDVFPMIEGFAECWGITILHCPYCHGYEFRNQETGIISKGEEAFEVAKLISNWTDKLTVFSNGNSDLPEEQLKKLKEKGIKVVEKPIASVKNKNGIVEHIEFQDGTFQKVVAIYARPNLEQNSKIPYELGCEITEQNLIKVDSFQKTSVEGVYACGDNAAMRSVATAVSTGSMAGAMLNRELINESF